VLTGTARIGLKALFPTQGPHAAWPTATDAKVAFCCMNVLCICYYTRLAAPLIFEALIREVSPFHSAPLGGLLDVSLGAKGMSGEAGWASITASIL
jgi:hypothetical protein